MFLFNYRIHAYMYSTVMWSRTTPSYCTRKAVRKNFHMIFPWTPWVSEGDDTHTRAVTRHNRTGPYTSKHFTAHRSKGIYTSTFVISCARIKEKNMNSCCWTVMELQVSTSNTNYNALQSPHYLWSSNKLTRNIYISSQEAIRILNKHNQLAYKHTHIVLTSSSSSSRD